MTEIGYFYDYDQLLAAYNNDVENMVPRNSSLFGLIKEKGLELTDVLFGASSLGARLEAGANGFRAVPSMTLPADGVTPRPGYTGGR